MVLNGAKDRHYSGWGIAADNKSDDCCAATGEADATAKAVRCERRLFNLLGQAGFQRMRQRFPVLHVHVDMRIFQCGIKNLADGC